MKGLRILLIFTLITLFFASCNRDGSMDGKEVEVRVSAGSAMVLTKSAFSEGTPVIMYIYQRQDPSKKDLAATPFKIVSGVADGEREITFTKGDLTADGKITLDIGYTYDFFIVANNVDDLPMSSGSIDGIEHGMNIMAGRKEGVEIATTESTVDIIFTEFGADEEGNLPRLNVGTAFDFLVTYNYIVAYGGSFALSIEKVIFSGMPEDASLPFDSGVDDIALVVNDGGYVTDYTMPVNSDPITVITYQDKITIDYGYLLPYITSSGINLVDMDFTVLVDDFTMTLLATDIELPNLRPGYRYTFTLAMDSDPYARDGDIYLFLTIEEWDGTQWSSNKGDDTVFTSFLLGSWGIRIWDKNMGDESTYIAIEVEDWQATSWIKELGDESTYLNGDISAWDNIDDWGYELGDESLLVDFSIKEWMANRDWEKDMGDESTYVDVDIKDWDQDDWDREMGDEGTYLGTDVDDWDSEQWENELGINKIE